MQLTSKQLMVTTHVQCVVLAATGILKNGDLEERRRERDREGERGREREREGEREWTELCGQVMQCVFV